VDLTEAARIAPKEAEVRLSLGELFTEAGLYSTAVAQYDLWLPAHAEDARRYEALGKRCRARAMGSMELEQALRDCNAAVRLNPLAPIGFYSRGLVWLRLGKFDQSISDYDRALKLAPKDAWALYGRGVAEARRGRAGDAQADFDAAARIYPPIEQRARNAGISP
jgi:tetratricopeptide (TPR) repeat protein